MFTEKTDVSFNYKCSLQFFYYGFPKSNNSNSSNNSRKNVED